MAVRRLFQDAKLVHADLSEYNLLWFESNLYVIDVSQAVELDHPMALDFLRRDLSIMNDFFQKKNLHTLSVKETYEFVTCGSLDDPEDYLQGKLEAAQNAVESTTKDEEHKDNIFKQIYIPQTMEEFSIDEIYRIQKENGEGCLEDLAKLTTF